MDTPQDFTKDTAQGPIVYIRPVKVADLPEEVRAQVHGARNIYAVHAADGNRLALVNGQQLAFVLARQNDMRPVHVH